MTRLLQTLHSSHRRKPVSRLSPGRRLDSGLRRNDKKVILVDLVAAARAAQQRAYAPYSRYRVGAAILAGGKIYTGSNVENVSYGLTICAERAAIIKAANDGFRRIEAAAVVVGQKDPKSPCGACLQVIAEFAAHEKIPVVLAGAKGSVTVRRFKDLVPYPCRIEGLKKE